MIKFDSVIKKNGVENSLFEGLSFEINPGDFVLLTGKSGAGKTTIGKLLIGDVKPDSGTITVDGEEISKMPAKLLTLLRRKIGFIFQDYKIIPDKTIFENLVYALEISGCPQKDIPIRINDLLSLVGIPEKGDLFPAQLSGGEIQRAAIARAIAGEPPYLFADEPTGNLDIITTQSIYELFEKINKKGTTIILATHDVTLINLHKGRHVHLDSGHITEENSITETTVAEAKTRKKVKKKKAKTKSDESGV